MKRLISIFLTLVALTLALPADARRHGASSRGHAAAHGSRHHDGGRHASSRHGKKERKARGHRSRGGRRAVAAAPAEPSPAISQDEAAALAVGASPGQVTAVTKTMRGRETFYSFDIAGADGPHRVLIDATHAKVMASIPLAQ